VTSIDEVRELEATRLDALQAALWPCAMTGSWQAAQTVLKIMDQRAKLLAFNVSATDPVTRATGGHQSTYDFTTMSIVPFRSKGSSRRLPASVAFRLAWHADLRCRGWGTTVITRRPRYQDVSASWVAESSNLRGPRGSTVKVTDALGPARAGSWSRHKGSHPQLPQGTCATEAVPTPDIESGRTKE
jgi:hypothetical protein